jgi:DNA-binding CsgD family transcriptional regulator
LVAVAVEDRRHIVAIAHPVHAEVVRDALTTRRSLQLNRQVADALEASGARRRDDVLRIAVSRLEAGGEVSAPLVTEAARRALAAYDLVLGERLARLAFTAGGGLPAGLDLGGALTRLGRPKEAAAVFEAIDLDGAGDRDRALVAMEWAECLFWGLGEPARAQAVLDDAWAAVADPEWKDQIIVTGAAYALLEGRPQDSLDAVDRIHEQGAPRGVTAASLIAAPALALMGRAEQAVAAADRGLAARDELADELGLVHVGMLVMARTVALTELGRLAEAIELGTQGHAIAVEATVEYAQAWFAMTTGRAHLLAGALADADRWFREAAARYADLALPANRRWCLYGSGWALALAGDVEAAEAMVQRARAIGPGYVQLMEPETKRAEAALALARGDRADAEQRLLAGADLAAERGLASQELAALHDLVRMGVTTPVDRLQALAADVDGDLASACVRHGVALRDGDGPSLGRACESFAALGATLLAAEAAAHAAAAHRAAGRRREATAWSARSLELVGPDDGRGSPTLRLRNETVALTDREREVATLATSGLRSKDIAVRLGLSRRTVDNHLHRAYTKLGVDGRDALAEALARTAE